MSAFIPIYQPSLDGNEKKYVDECIDSSWISSKGKFIKLFEDEFAAFVGARHASSVSNGTVALQLALATLGIGKNDEVIVPSFTYIASVSTICHAGATPVFADSLSDTWQIDPEDVQKKITPRTRAIMAVHLYGHPCEMDPLVAIAKEHNLHLVEDCAEAFGSRYRGKHVGSFGSMATFSFYGNKTITTGEGGMVVTNNPALYDRCHHLKMHGLARNREYWHDALGFNFRMTNICAAIGLAQLERGEEKIAAKRDIAEWYTADLKDVPVTPHRESPHVVHSYWMYSILTQSPTLRDSLRDFLRNAGIETRPTFYPVHTMPMFSQERRHLPVAEDLGLRGINLPSWPGLTRDQVRSITSAIAAFFHQQHP
ncbi:MAG TPA: DegT/DnrJ/EryC1/StrS family aminotransferase [Bacteroidota bacterium]|nr:DegT/DnrJ/EryC1/StrS family aminotransferase [Bacteroidota bacterium]